MRSVSGTRRILISLLLLLPGAGRGDVTLEVVALSGESPAGGPAGAVYEDLAHNAWVVPRQNASGQLAWRGLLESGVGGVTAADATAVWGPVGAGHAPVLRQGQAPPGAPPGAVLSGTVWTLELNAAGHVLLGWPLATGIGGITPDTDDGYWLSDGQGGISLVARAGDPAPGTPDVFVAVNAFLDGAGRVALRGRTDSASGFSDEGIWVKEPGVALTPLLLEGDPAPVVPGAEISWFHFPVVAGSGELAVRGFLRAGVGGVTSDDNLVMWWRDAGGVISIVAREDDPVPGAPGDLYFAFSNPLLSDVGHLAFAATLDLGGQALMGPDGFGGLTRLHGEGDPAPDIPGAELLAAGPNALNRHGEIAFIGTLAQGIGGVTAADDQVLYGPAADGSPEVRLREGSALPGTGGLLVMEIVGSASMNDRGETASIGRLLVGTGGVTIDDRDVLVLTRKGGDAEIIVRDRDEIEVAPGDVRTVNAFYACCNPAEGSSRFLFTAEFLDGSSALMAANVTSAAPIPAAWGLAFIGLTVGAAWVATRRGRR